MKGVTDALSRLSGVNRVSVRLQEGFVIAETDASQPVLPASIWKEIARVGFVPAQMEIWAEGTFEAGAFLLDGKSWPLVGSGPPAGTKRRVHLKVLNGGEDPPRVELVE